jgi:hypothetical protein
MIIKNKFQKNVTVIRPLAGDGLGFLVMLVIKTSLVVAPNHTANWHW